MLVWVQVMSLVILKIMLVQVQETMHQLKRILLLTNTCAATMKKLMEMTLIEAIHLLCLKIQLICKEATLWLKWKTKDSVVMVEVKEETLYRTLKMVGSMIYNSLWMIMQVRVKFVTLMTQQIQMLLDQTITTLILLMMVLINRQEYKCQIPTR